MLPFSDIVHSWNKLKNVTILIIVTQSFQLDPLIDNGTSFNNRLENTFGFNLYISLPLVTYTKIIRK